jgi:two-component system response regulator FimZ (fimbrial Z protein)/two-component system response regulator EvgA
MKRVVIADDHPAMIWALRSMLSTQIHFEVVGETTSGEGCLDLCRKINPDLVLLDIDLPGMDGLDVLRRLKHSQPSTRILVISSLDEQLYSGRVRHAGGHGYINKSVSSDIIMAACLAVSQGYTFFHAQNGKTPIEDEDKISSFSAREFQILKYLANGASNNAISEILHISNKTVATYKKRIYTKIGIDNIADLISFCRCYKIIDE